MYPVRGAAGCPLVGGASPPACSAARYRTSPSTPFGTSPQMPSPFFRPSARSPWTSLLERASSSPAVYCVPSGSTAATHSGSACASRQKPNDPIGSPYVSTVSAVTGDAPAPKVDHVLVLLIKTYR